MYNIKADLGELQRSAFHHLNKSETIEREQQPLSLKQTFNAPLMKRQKRRRRLWQQK